MISLSKNEIIIASVMALCTVLLLPYLPLLAIGVGMLLAIYFTHEKYYVPLIIIIFFVIPSDLGEALRNILNILILGYLGFRYVQSRGFTVNILEDIPFNIKLLVSLILLSIFLSSFFSENVLYCMQIVFRQFTFFLILLFIYNEIKNMDDVYRYIYSMIGASVIISVAIIIHFFTSDTTIYIMQTRGLIQETAYIGNHAAIGGLFAVTIIITLALLFIKKDKTILLFVFIVQMIGLIFANSRAGLMALFFGALFVLFKLRFKLAMTVLLSLIGIVVFTFLFLPGVVDAVGILIRSDRVLENSRYTLWEISLDIYKNNPVFGVGPSMFKHYMYRYLPVMMGSWQESQIRWLFNVTALGHSHNYYLFRLSELGILGIFTAVMFPVVYFITAARTISKITKKNVNYPLIVGFIGVCIGLLYRSFFEATGLISHGWITRDLPIWLIMVFMVFILKNNSESTKVNEDSNFK